MLNNDDWREPEDGEDHGTLAGAYAWLAVAVWVGVILWGVWELWCWIVG